MSFPQISERVAPLQVSPFVAYDMTWTLPVGADCARALRFLERLNNRLAIYSNELQSLHFHYQLHADIEVGLIGVQLGAGDGLTVPSTAIEATPSYIISGELAERDQLQMALWHHPRKPPLLYSLSSALQRMIHDSSDCFFPILHERSVSILPQSQHAVARIYRLKLAELNMGEIELKRLRRQLNSSLVTLLS